MQWIKAPITLLAAVILGWGATASDLSAQPSDDQPKSDKAFLGVYLADLDLDRREALDYAGDGVLVEDLVEDGPAQKAGLKAGDIVTKVNKDKVTDGAELRDALLNYKPGDKVDISFVRDGKDKSLKVELAEAPQTSFSVINRDYFKGGFLGVETMSLSNQLADFFKVKGGALVESVVEDSPAKAAGIMAGDVIIQVGDEEVESSGDLMDAVRSHDPGAEVKVVVMRDGKRMEFNPKLAESSGLMAPRFGGGRKSIRIINDEDFDWNEIQEHIQDAMRNMDFNINIDKEEMQELRNELKKELDEIKRELEELKKERKKE